MNKKYAKDYIIEALLILMKKQEFDTITITDITKKAGVNRVTFYRNFSSKEEIIKVYLDDITIKFIEDTKIVFDPNHLEQYITTLFHHLLLTRDIGTTLYKANLIHYIKEEFDKILSNKAVTNEEKYSYYFLSGGLFNVYYYWIIHGCVETPEELASLFIKFSYIKGSSE